MSPTVSLVTAELARLISEGASAELISGARERRAVAERAEERQQLLDIIARLDRCRTYRRGASLAPEEVRLLLDELYVLKGASA